MMHTVAVPVRHQVSDCRPKPVSQAPQSKPTLPPAPCRPLPNSYRIKPRYMCGLCPIGQRLMRMWPVALLPLDARPLRPAQTTAPQPASRPHRPTAANRTHHLPVRQSVGVHSAVTLHAPAPIACKRARCVLHIATMQCWICQSTFHNAHGARSSRSTSPRFGAFARPPTKMLTVYATNGYSTLPIKP